MKRMNERNKVYQRIFEEKENVQGKNAFFGPKKRWILIILNLFQGYTEEVHENYIDKFSKEKFLFGANGPFRTQKYISS